MAESNKPTVKEKLADPSLLEPWEKIVDGKMSYPGDDPSNPPTEFYDTVYMGKEIKLDVRKRVSADGSRIIWKPGYNIPNKKLVGPLSGRPKSEWSKEEIEMFEKGVEKHRQGKLLRKALKAKSTKKIISEVLASVPVKGEIPEETIAAVLELEEKLGQDLTRQQIMVHAIIAKAMGGSVEAFREILDRTEGKVVNKSENKNLNVTYEDWLKNKARQESGDDIQDEEEDDD